jgi:hypothetical protein
MWRGYDKGSARLWLRKRLGPHESASCGLQPLMQAERMLQSYEREMSSVESTLREMEENLDTTRFEWEGRRMCGEAEETPSPCAGACARERGTLRVCACRSSHCSSLVEPHHTPFFPLYP